MNALTTVLYDWPRIVTGHLTWLAPLAVRIVVGWVFIWTGLQKLGALPRMIENFREWESRAGNPDAVRFGNGVRGRPASAGGALTASCRSR